MLVKPITVQASYTVKCSQKAIDGLHKLNSDDQTRVEHILEEVSKCRKPTDHPKVKVLNNNHSETLYKIRIGDMRAVAHLNKPVLEILRFGPRSSVYDDIERVYDAL